MRTGDGDGAAVNVAGGEGEGRAVVITAIVRSGDGDGARVRIRGNEGEGVVPDTTPFFPSFAGQSVTVNTAYSFTLPRARQGNPPLVYSLTGTLPTGITFTASTRVLAGTPTDLGSFPLTYQVEDDDGDTDTADFTLTVRAVGAGEYSILVDTDGDGSFATDIFADVISFNHSTGVFGVRRQGIGAGAGTLKVSLYNNDLAARCQRHLGISVSAWSTTERLAGAGASTTRKKSKHPNDIIIYRPLPHSAYLRTSAATSRRRLASRAIRWLQMRSRK